MTSNRNGSNIVKLFSIASAILMLTVCSITHAEVRETYTDKIYLKNGDRLTGNIKELDRGKLRLKTLTMDTVYLNWVDIQSVESDKYLRVTNTDGTFNYGRVKKSDISEDLIVTNQNEQVEVPQDGIATIRPIRTNESAWQRLEGEASAGIDYKKASDILLVNVASSLRWRQEEHEFSLGLNWNETTRTEDNNSSRADLSGTYTRLLRKNWFWKASGGFERNQELGIDLRTIVGGSAGKYFFQTSTMRFEVNGGLAASKEKRQDGTNLESVEGMIRSSFDLFKLNIPTTRLSANINVFPGITESGRLRVNTDISLRNEIVRDLFWDLSFYSTYDNQPAENAASEDYGIVTSIGASF
jgi:hypothetical protein